MANAVYPSFLDALWKGNIDTDVDTFKVAILGSGYTFDATHDFYSSLSNILGEATLTSITVTDGVFDAADVTVTGVTVSTMAALVIFKWTGSAATSQLMLFFDFGVGFSVSPTGDVLIVWPNTANAKIYPLGGI